jgi:hypothetical protein
VCIWNTGSVWSISNVFPKLTQNGASYPLKFALHHCAPIYAVWSNLRDSICIFWAVGVISVLDGDRNKAVLVAKIFVLLELQWVSLFRETKGS